jgi:hypothetical protein
MSERHLAQTEAHVVQGERHIARQMAIIAELELGRHEDASQTARELLASFEAPQASHIGDRDRLRGRMAGLD